MEKQLNNKQDIVCSIIFIMLGIFFYIGSLKLESVNIGTGYFPKLISKGIILLNIIYLIKSLKINKKINYFENNNILNKCVFFKVIGITIVFLLLWKYVSFIILSSIYLITLGIIFQSKLIKSMLFSILVTIFIYLIFTKLFHVMLN